MQMLLWWCTLWAYTASGPATATCQGVADIRGSLQHVLVQGEAYCVGTRRLLAGMRYCTCTTTMTAVPTRCQRTARPWHVLHPELLRWNPEVRTLESHRCAVPRERAANLLLAFRARGQAGGAAAAKAAEGVCAKSFVVGSSERQRLAPHDKSWSCGVTCFTDSAATGTWPAHTWSRATCPCRGKCLLGGMLATAAADCASWPLPRQLARAAAKEALAPLLATVAGRLAFVLRQAFAIATQGASSCVHISALSTCTRGTAAVAPCTMCGATDTWQAFMPWTADVLQTGQRT